MQIRPRSIISKVEISAQKHRIRQERELSWNRYRWREWESSWTEQLKQWGKPTWVLYWYVKDGAEYFLSKQHTSEKFSWTSKVQCKNSPQQKQLTTYSMSIQLRFAHRTSKKSLWDHNWIRTELWFSKHFELLVLNSQRHNATPHEHVSLLGDAKFNSPVALGQLQTLFAHTPLFLGF